MAPGQISNASSFDEEKENDGTIQDLARELQSSHDQNEAATVTDDKPAGQQQDVEKGGAETSAKAAPPIFDPRQNPDGGLQAWLCVLGAFCTLFCSFGWINTIAVFQNYYQTHQLKEYSPSTVSWIPSLETFMNFFLGPW